MHINEKRAFFLEQLNILSKTANLSLEFSDSHRQILNFLDEQGNYLLDQVKHPDTVLQSIFSSIPDFDYKNSVDHLNTVIAPYLKAIGLNFNFPYMIWDEVHRVGIKDDFKSVNDVSYYSVTFFDRPDSEHLTVFNIRLYLHPVDAFYNVKKDSVGHDIVNIRVYYKDLHSIVKPMLSSYLDFVSKRVTYAVDMIDDEIVEVLDMIKIS